MKKVTFNQSIIYYQVEGEGLPILFIHPPGIGRVVFHAQLPLANYYQLILPDFSGHGQSTSPSHRHIIKQYCSEIEAILDHEGIDKAILCAYSAGGIIAQTFACQYPDRTEALIVSGGYPNVSTARLHLLYYAGMLSLRMTRNYLTKILAASNTANDLDKTTLVKHINQTDFKKWYQYYFSTHQVNIKHYLDNINCPSLFVYGNKLDFTYYYQQVYQSQSRIELAFVDLGTHQIPVKKAQAFNHLVKQFIDRHI
ncbi:alpha/beta fold hydrolase [Amphibacillus sediminis]|uniref:alpha/beta fold hydrolase n=1 Tax=Amphibacillus sediminis TaxID=360185 RepID=UPI00082AFF2A|nr:alpha/beta hydrolase [Amphibacillus sediminis]